MSRVNNVSMETMSAEVVHPCGPVGEVREAVKGTRVWTVGSNSRMGMVGMRVPRAVGEKRRGWHIIGRGTGVPQIAKSGRERVRRQAED